MNIRITPQEFNFKKFRDITYLTRRRGNQGYSNKFYFKDVVCAFDIETSKIEVKGETHSFMYLWQFQIGTECTVLGRTWEQFQWFMTGLKNNMMGDGKLCIFVHNLSYEFQFLSGIYKFKSEEVFAIKSRKILKCEMFNMFEFRCSYLHSNMSLEQYTNKMDVEHKKLSGEEFDYSIVRYPWTPLKEKELDYAVNDVLGLVESIQTEMALDGDTLYTFPMTSTGYVRRDAKKAMRKVGHKYIAEQFPDIDLYTLEREAFRGGNTHANRYYAGKILHNVRSADRVSSYPSEQVNALFPIRPFEYRDGATFDDVMHYMNDRHKPVIMRIGFTNIHLRDKYWGAPYLARSKCRNIKEPAYDNGRILSADYLETTITDVDLKIILGEYDFDDAEVSNVYTSGYGRLPGPLVQVTLDYFKNKTELKNVEGQEIFYMKNKNKLNSIYGMSAQDPVKQSIDYIDGDYIEEEEPVEGLLEHTKRKAFLNYAWGVWITAWARYELEEGIKLAGDNFVYCDTDSVKYLGDIDWTEYNKKCMKACKESGGYATDPQGVTHYLGVFEQEHDMCEFSTLGSKKYCYRETPDSELVITIAGVPKKKGAAELEKSGGIKAFKEGFIFSKSGKTEAVYNDLDKTFAVKVDGHKLIITNNVVIRDTQYTLGITGEYARLLENSKIL